MADSTSGLLTFVDELKRRRVFRAAAVYAAVGFVITQAAALLQPALLLPEWTYRLVVFLLLLGFPVALVLAWSFDITSQGVLRTESRKKSNDAGADRSARVPPLRAETADAAEADPRPGNGKAATQHTIAVLPLSNLAGGEENEYFADGITEDILTNLGLVPDFTVISRTSVMRYKESDRSVPEIARELGAEYVVEGSIRRVGDQVRVVVQLVEPDTDAQIWARTLDRRIEDIFSLQSEIAHSVVEALRVELTGGVGHRIRRAPTDDLAAYELFLHARDLYYRYSRSAMEQAIELFGQAVAKDPQFALAHAWLGSAYAVYVNNYSGDPALREAAVESARRAIALEPDLSDGHRALGTALAVSGQLDEAISVLERAIELNPNDFGASNNLGLACELRGEHDRAIALARDTLLRDPVRSYIAYNNMAGVYLKLELYARGEEAAKRALELRPEYEHALHHLSYAYLYQGRTADAVSVAERLASHEAPAPGFLGSAAMVLLRAGEEVRALSLLERAYSSSPEALQADGHGVSLAYLLSRAGATDRAAELLASAEQRIREVIDSGDVNPALYVSLARISAVRGDRTAALGQLERAVVERGFNDPPCLLHDPVLAPLQDEPRFRGVIARMHARIQPMRERVVREGQKAAPPVTVPDP